MTTMVTRLDRAPGIEDPGRVSGAGRQRPDPEVPERARRRTFTAQYKLEVLAAYDAAPEGEKGVLLRREGLYSSHIVEWRRARDAGALAGLAPQIGVRATCHAVGGAQAGYYRRHRTSPAPPRPTPMAHRDRPQPRALTEHEQQAILDVLHSPRFVDAAPAHVWATLLD